MSAITTHVLDAVLGKPAAGILVRLDKRENDAWAMVSESATDADGRCRDLAPIVSAGLFRLSFASGAYLARTGRTSLYPEIVISFHCDGETNYHLPILLSDNSYTTYRGS
jgi:5-hydroxyisourate hydrolase